MTGQRAPFFFFLSNLLPAGKKSVTWAFLLDEKWVQRETVMNFRSTSKNKSPLFSFFSSKLGYLLIHQPAPVLLKQRRGAFRRNGRVFPRTWESNTYRFQWMKPFSYFSCLHFNQPWGTCTDQRRGNEKKLCESQYTIVYFSFSYPYWRNRTFGEREKKCSYYPKHL